MEGMKTATGQMGKLGSDKEHPVEHSYENICWDLSERDMFGPHVELIACCSREIQTVKRADRLDWRVNLKAEGSSLQEIDENV